MTLSTRNIIIIAGPSASGKSYLIKQLLSNQSEILTAGLLRKLKLNKERKLGKINIERLTNTTKMRRRSKKMKKDIHIVHFDLTSRNQTQRRLQLREISSECKSLKVVTLRLSFKTWKERMTERFRNRLIGIPISQAFWIYALSLINTNLAKHFFESVYTEWDLFLDSIAIKSKIYIDD